MPALSASAVANPNIAFIKYWGNRDAALKLPANGSISMNLDSLFTHAAVTFDDSLAQDELTINGRQPHVSAVQRAGRFFDHIRRLAGISTHARIESQNNFPSGAGIASSASAFAALALAGSRAAGLELTERDLSRLARLGSGSACRSVPGGFTEWLPGAGDEDSFAVSIAPPEHWPLVDCIAIVNEGHKPVGSTEGHALSTSSPLQEARLQDAPRRVENCRRAILAKDFDALARVAEEDSNLMHAVMITSSPPLFYWQPVTLEIIRQVPQWRAQGLPAFFTIDAGPNVHVFSTEEGAWEVCARLKAIPGVKRVQTARPGGPARLV